MNFNWLKLLLQVITLAPTVIQGVEAIAGEKDSASKHQLAKDALTLASGVAASVDPADAQTIGAVSSATSAIIDGTVAAFNASGVFKHKAAAA